jgi:hypothetical protein
VGDPAGRRAVSVKDTDETLIDDVCSRIRELLVDDSAEHA